MRIKITLDGVEREVDWTPAEALAKLRARWPDDCLVSIDLDFNLDHKGKVTTTARAYTGACPGETARSFSDNSDTIEAAVESLLLKHDPVKDVEAKLAKAVQLRAQADALEDEALKVSVSLIPAEALAQKPSAPSPC